MTHNIFARAYKVQENYWTEVLFKFLERAGLSARRAFLQSLGLNPTPELCKDLSFCFQETEDASVPDATVRDSASRLRVHVEVKRGPGFSVDQAQRHLRSLRSYSVRRRILLLITGNPSEPIEFTRFARRARDRQADVRFLSWHDIYRIACRTASMLRKEPEAFIAREYKEFLEMEIKPETPWAGFSMSFSAQWRTATKLKKELAKLVREMSQQVEEAIGKYPAFSGFTAMRVQESPGAVFKRWWLWRRRKTWVKVGVGLFESEDDENEHIICSFYDLSPKATALLERSSRRKAIDKKLKSSGFYVEDDLSYLEDWVSIEKTLMKMRPDEQRRKILSFVSGSIRRFYRSGVTRVVCR